MPPARDPGTRKTGEILEGAFGLYRRHLGLFACIMAPAAFVATAAGIPLRLQRAHILDLLGSGADPREALSAAGLMLAGLGVAAVVSMMVYGVAGGAVALATVDALAGRAMTALQAYEALGAKAARTLGSLALLALVGASLGGVAGAIAAAPFAAVALVGVGSLAGPIAAVMGMLLALSALAGVAIILLARYGLVVQAVVLDDLGAIAALGRSSSLTRRRRGRVLLITLIAALVASIGMFLIEAPFEIAGSLAARSRGGTPIWAEALSVLAGCIGGAALWPIVPISLTLLHVDLSGAAPAAPSRPGSASLQGAP